jgi:protein-S-isoprenylcysteine O-methyltransferase Ste14
MIYTPSKYPKKAFTLITVMVAVGIFGGYLISQYFMAVALLFWIQYTAVLSYLQFKRKSKCKRRNLTEYLLYPQIRFFIFEFLAVLGIGSLLKYNNYSIGAAALAAWWLFSLNFFVYYKQFRKYEK